MPNSKLRKSGNIAIANVGIEGLKNKFVAHSQIGDKYDKGWETFDFSPEKEEGERIFKSYKPYAHREGQRPYTRYHDTEAKILEDIASKIHDPLVVRRNNFIYSFTTLRELLKHYS